MGGVGGGEGNATWQASHAEPRGGKNRLRCGFNKCGSDDFFISPLPVFHRREL